MIVCSCGFRGFFKTLGYVKRGEGLYTTFNQCPSCKKIKMWLVEFPIEWNPPNAVDLSDKPEFVNVPWQECTRISFREPPKREREVSS